MKEFKQTEKVFITFYNKCKDKKFWNIVLPIVFSFHIHRCEYYYY